MRVFVIGVLVLLLCCTFSHGVTAQQQEDSFETSQYGRFPFVRLPNNSVLITVNGESRIEIPADYAQVSATVETVYSNTSGALTDQASVIRDVSQRTAMMMTRVLDVLRGNSNVTKITTTQVELSPIYNWTTGAQVLVGYRAVNSIEFRVELASTGSVLDSIVNAGISRIDSITYAASAQHIAAARTRAIQEAIKDAQMQATAMTTTMNITATPTIFRIDMISASPPSPVQMPYASVRTDERFARLMAVSQPIVGGNLVIVARVRVRFLVERETSSPSGFRVPRHM